MSDGAIGQKYLQEMQARPGHEESFRATWRLVDEVANDPQYVAAYEYAAKYKLTITEMAILGPALVRKDGLVAVGDEFSFSERETEALVEAGLLPTERKRWHPPNTVVGQAMALREFLRQGKGALVLQCERTRQQNPDNPSSPVIVCEPSNTNMPCWNCTVAILTGRKSWDVE